MALTSFSCACLIPAGHPQHSIQPTMPAAALDWEGFLQLWSIPEAEAFLCQAASEPLPKRGRLQQLLVRTQQILFHALKADAFQSKEAVAAVQCQAVALLARPLHRLQQSPKLELSSIAKHPLKSTWYCVLLSLHSIMERLCEQQYVQGRSNLRQVPEASETGRIALAFTEQMNQATGRL